MSTVINFGERPPTRRKARQVSVHESGHIVSACTLYLPVRGGGFAAGRLSPSRVMRGIVYMSEPRSRDECRRRAVVALAGPVAESVWFAERGRRRRVERLPSFQADAASARVYLQRAGVTRQRMPDAFAECLAEAREILADPENWASVERVARAIRRDGWLDRYDVMSEVWG